MNYIGYVYIEMHSWDASVTHSDRSFNVGNSEELESAMVSRPTKSKIASGIRPL